MTVPRPIHTIKGLLRTGTCNLDFKSHPTPFYLLQFSKWITFNTLSSITVYRNWIPQNAAEVVALHKPVEIVYA